MTTDFKTLLERATRKIAYKKYNTVQNHNFNAFEKGAELPNELLLKALEVLELYSKKPEYKEIEYTDNWCDDYCPNDCKEHSVERIGKFRPVAHGMGKAADVLNEIRSRLESEAK